MEETYATLKEVPDEVIRDMSVDDQIKLAVQQISAWNKKIYLFNKSKREGKLEEYFMCVGYWNGVLDVLDMSEGLKA